MPTYEYKCTKCGNIFERFQGIKEPPYTECPSCKGPVKRLIGTGGGLLFKGNGFYITDYRSKNYNEAKKKEQGSTATKKKEG